MEAVVIQILVQTLNIDAMHLITGLVGIIGVIMLIILNDMKSTIKENKATNKEIHALYLDHEKRLIKIETKEQQQHGL